MDADFTKWMWLKAGGIFEYTKWSDVYEEFGFPTCEHKHPLKRWVEDDLFHDVGYPLLLQRAIESVNDDTEEWVITQFCDSIEVARIGYCSKWFRGASYDKTKEPALHYIYEQEKANAT